MTVRTTRVWQQQIKTLANWLRRTLEIFKRLRTPIALHHDRQAINYYVKEAAYEQAKQSGRQNKGQHVAGQIIEQDHA